MLRRWVWGVNSCEWDWLERKLYKCCKFTETTLISLVIWVQRCVFNCWTGTVEWVQLQSNQLIIGGYIHEATIISLPHTNRPKPQFSQLLIRTPSPLSTVTRRKQQIRQVQYCRLDLMHDPVLFCYASSMQWYARYYIQPASTIKVNLYCRRLEFFLYSSALLCWCKCMMAYNMMEA